MPRTSPNILHLLIRILSLTEDDNWRCRLTCAPKRGILVLQESNCDPSEAGILVNDSRTGMQCHSKWEWSVIARCHQSDSFSGTLGSCNRRTRNFLIPGPDEADAHEIFFREKAANDKKGASLVVRKAFRHENRQTQTVFLSVLERFWRHSLSWHRSLKERPR